MVAAAVAAATRSVLSYSPGVSSQVLSRCRHVTDALVVQESLVQQRHEEHFLGASIAAAKASGSLSPEAGRAARGVQRRANRARHAPFPGPERVGRFFGG